ncbi:hypothetical protein MKY20_23870 [Cytobacillus sp. FSL W8-0315]
MIKVPADRLAQAVNKYLLPGLLRSLSDQQKDARSEKVANSK